MCVPAKACYAACDSMPATTVAQVLPQVSAALSAREIPRAFELLAPFYRQLDEDRDLASAWLTLLRIAPARTSLSEDVALILKRWPHDVELVTSACDALIRAAELEGPTCRRATPDPPPRPPPPPRAAWRRVGGRAVSQRPGGYLQINRANALRLAHRFGAAAEASSGPSRSTRTTATGGSTGSPVQAANQFEAALKDNERAHELLGDRKGVLWNIAICATALGRGEVAATALQKLGFKATVQSSGMPFVEDVPPVQVRVATRGSGHGMSGPELDRGVAFELVWVSPASPCHGVVQTATFRDGSADYGDLVLWDGTPVGITEHEGKKVPRFPLLSVLRRGDEHRYRFVALEQDPGDVLAFGEGLPRKLRYSCTVRPSRCCARAVRRAITCASTNLKAEPHRLVYGKCRAGQVELRDSGGPQGHLPRTRSPAGHAGLLEAIGDTQGAGRHINSGEGWSAPRSVAESRD